MNPDLLAQMTKLIRYDRSGSFLCKKRREQAFTTFLNYVSAEYSKRKISNINNKHIVSYVAMRLARGISIKSIKTELSAIRHYLDLAGAHASVTNEELGLQNPPKTAKQGAFEAEIDRAVSVAKPDIQNAIILMANFGLRENEASSISIGQLLDAKDKKYLRIKGKGGRIRNIPVETSDQVSVLENSIQNIGRFNGNLKHRDDKFFADNTKGSVLRFKRRLSQFWIRKQKLIADPDRQDSISNHDLRRYYAQQQYCRARRSGKSKEAALGIVSKDLGHGYRTENDAVVGTRRSDIARVYVADKS